MMSALCLVSLMSRDHIKIDEIPLIPDLDPLALYHLKGFTLYLRKATPTKSLTTQQFHIYRFFV